MGRWKGNKGNEQLIEGLSYLIGINKKREARYGEVREFMCEVIDRIESCEEMLEDLHERLDAYEGRSHRRRR